MSLRIAILAPLKRAITSKTTVSRNRVIVDLVEELIKRGHTVTIFGTGESRLPGVEFVSVCPKALTELPPAENEFYQHTSYLIIEIAELVKRQKYFDIVHNNMYPEYLPLMVPITIPLVTTVHSQMTSLTSHVFHMFPSAHLIAISRMAKKVAGISSMEVIHNSIDTEFFTPSTDHGEYLLAVGRMSKSKDANGNFLDPKGIGNAIAVAKQAGMPLKIVGNVEDPVFFETIVRPHLSDMIQFVGEISSEQKVTREQMHELFAHAKAFINPINWEEPFGLVMAEALSCGTPVVAFNCGAVSEIIDDGNVGFVVDRAKGIDGIVAALKQIDTIDRAACRKYAVANFSIKRMADEYEALYQRIVRAH